MRQREADRSPELSHYGPQTAEDKRNRRKLCWTLAFELAYWTLNALLTMEKKHLNAQHQAKTSTVHSVPQIDRSEGHYEPKCDSFLEQRITWLLSCLI